MKLAFVNLFIFLSFLGVSSEASAERVVERVLAVVGDEFIFQTDLQKYQAALKGSSPLLEKSLLNFESKKKLLSSRKHLLNHLINERALDFMIKSKGTEVQIEDIEKEIFRIASSNGASINALEKSLLKRGVSISDYRTFIKRSLERPRFINQFITSTINISELDILNEYAKSNSGFLADSSLNLEKIEFSSKAAAWAAYKKIKASGYLGYVSELSETKDFNWGVFTLSDLNPTIRAALASSDIGDITKPVSLSQGVFSILYVKNKEATTASNSLSKEEKARLRGAISRRLAAKKIKKWIDQTKEDIFIRIN